MLMEPTTGRGDPAPTTTQKEFLEEMPLVCERFKVIFK
jgi:hypothetical protein